MLNISLRVCALKVGEREKGKWLFILCQKSVCVNELSSFYSCTIWRFQVCICVHSRGTCMYECILMWWWLLFYWIESTMIDAHTHTYSTTRPFYSSLTHTNILPGILFVLFSIFFVVLDVSGLWLGVNVYVLLMLACWRATELISIDGLVPMFNFYAYTVKFIMLS